MRLDQINFAVIHDFIAAKLASGLSKKSINSYLTVLRRSLVIAKKRELIRSVPEIEWLRAPKPSFDFLDFEEADRLGRRRPGERPRSTSAGRSRGMSGGPQSRKTT
jgi:hypothetical protein